MANNDLETVRECDVLVIGAGPAGLAAAHELASSPLSVVVVDSGRPLDQRDRYAEEEATQGVGGAGLYSDGKFSFYPSATQVWQLPDEALLRQSYQKVQDLVSPYGVVAPPFPTPALPETPPDNDSGDWTLKPYPSYYMSPEDRYDLTKSLTVGPRTEFLLSTTARHCDFVQGLGRFSVQLATADGPDRISAKYLVLAGGRFSPANFPLDSEMVFQRLEVGCRIEQPTNDSLLGDLDQLDPKLKLTAKDGSVEWRTFCACRQGETLQTETQGFWTVSGRADCPPTGKSNVGFNMRIQDSELALRSWQHIRRTFARPDSYFNVPLGEALTKGSPTHDHLSEVYGANLLDNLLAGILLLAKDFPHLLSPSTRLSGPSLEGVNDYPKLQDNLQIPGLPAWVAGDSTGKFRGIVAALISGHYVAKQILKMEAESQS